MSTQLSFIESNISLRKKTYYQMGGTAKYMAFPRSLSDIQQTIFFAKQNKLPIAILGAGSNSIFSDEYFDGVVLALENLSSWWWETDDILFAESGVTNTKISEICLKAERGGASWMYLLPGQIGASVRMNARCYGGEMTQIVTDILTIDQNGHLHSYDAKKILLGYKHTALMLKPEIVVGVRFYFPNTLSAKDILSHMQECENDRTTKKHFLFPSCGSTFKNNYEYGKPSGHIFDELGLKGMQKGDAEISMYHANVVWNKNAALTKDMLNLYAFMRDKAYHKLGVKLDLEVQPIGVFNRDDFESCGMKNSGFYVQKNNQYLTGFFYIPNAEGSKDLHEVKAEQSIVDIVESVFPICIFSSFFTNYNKNKIEILPKVRAEIVQLKSLAEAIQNPDTPFLKWITICDQNVKDVFNKIPESNEDCEKLWEFSVSEIFFAHHNHTDYLECELTPYGHRLIIDFNDIRQKNKILSDQQSIKFKFEVLEDNQTQVKFSLEFCFNDLKKYIADSSVNIQCALSLGDQKYFLSPYWYENIQKSEKVDFHQLEKFWNLILIYFIGHE